MSADAADPQGFSLDKESPYRIALPEELAKQSGLSDCDEAAITFGVDRQFPCLRLTPAASPTHAVGPKLLTRKIGARNGESTPHVTLPYQIVEAAGLQDTEIIPYVPGGAASTGFEQEQRYRDSPDDGTATTDAEGEYHPLVLVSKRPSRLEGGTPARSGNATVSDHRRSRLVIRLPEELVSDLTVEETVAVSLDRVADNPVLVVDVDDASRPPGAIEVTANPNTRREEVAGLSFYLPNPIVRALNVRPGTQRWSRIEQSGRLVGAVK